ncbi:hypothetical protein CEXT_681731 [Caerostris extrusa]|uniref:Uncharacterized protein n=1 Tax=Caerostris extrusa TaxID=172846 RepID=A0AAV4NBY6_CAEEX|nr:hypothetical protein CEXT_681731 [Caerostris extrusa]
MSNIHVFHLYRGSDFVELRLDLVLGTTLISASTLKKYLPLDFGGSCCRDEKASKTAQKLSFLRYSTFKKESLKDDTEKPFDCLLRSLTDIQVQHHANFEACNAKKGIQKRKGVKRKNTDSISIFLAQNLTKNLKVA